MKPLKGVGYQNQAMPKQGAKGVRGQTYNANQTQANKKQSHFTDYNFFSQKLSSNGIPKNQEIKYRKEMQ